MEANYYLGHQQVQLVYQYYGFAEFIIMFF